MLVLFGLVEDIPLTLSTTGSSVSHHHGVALSTQQGCLTDEINALCHSRVPSVMMALDPRVLCSSHNKMTAFLP